MSERRQARECALQVLYALDLNLGAELSPALAYFWLVFTDELQMVAERPAVTYAEAVVRGVVEHLGDIDAALKKVSRNWRLERMAVVDRNLLRLATWELLFGDVPIKVVINEAIEIAKCFGADESPAFVNGLLDHVAQEVRR